MPLILLSGRLHEVVSINSVTAGCRDEAISVYLAWLRLEGVLRFWVGSECCLGIERLLQEQEPPQEDDVARCLVAACALASPGAF